MDLTLNLLDGELAVCRLDAGAEVPAWALGSGGPFASVTRTTDELSVVCPWDAVPPNRPEGLLVEGPWRALSVSEQLDFSLTGIAAALTAPLAEAGISVFLIATYDTDHLLVTADTLEASVAALEGAGIRVRRPGRAG